MNGNAISWDLWRSFLAVAEEGSLSAAARRLGLTQPTVGRHVDLLEAAAGANLFLRSPHGLTLSDVGRSLLPEARTMAAVAAGLERIASAPSEAEKGILRLAASEVVGAEILPDLLTPLLHRHPGLEVELVLSNRNEDLLRREADLAVRMARPTQGGLLARKLGTVGIGLFAHRAYLSRHGVPVRIEDLSEHVLIGPDRDAATLAALKQVPGLERRLLRFRCDRESAQINAVRAGMGIGALQRGIARNSALVPVLEEFVRFDLECWMVTHEDLRASTRVRLVYDHLAATLPRALSG